MNEKILARKEEQGTSNVTTYTWDSRNRLTGISGPSLSVRAVSSMGRDSRILAMAEL